MNSIPSSSELELAALANAAVPGLRVLGTKDYASWKDGSCVTLVDGEGQDWQVATTSDLAPEPLEHLFRVLALLGEASDKRDLPFRVPAPVAVAARPKGGLALIYPHLGGSVAGPATLVRHPMFAASLASALAALHQLPVDTYSAVSGALVLPEERRAEYLALVEEHRMAIPGDLAARWLGALRDDTLWLYQPVPVHGSLTAEDLQVAEGSAVVGVRGFESARVDDPAYDVLWLLYEADDAFLESFEAAYWRGRPEPDLHMMTRAQLIAELDTLRWYAHAAQTQDNAAKEAGLRSLREMATELDGDLLVAEEREVLQISFTASQEPLLRVNPHLLDPMETSATVVADQLDEQAVSDQLDEQVAADQLNELQD